MRCRCPRRFVRPIFPGRGSLALAPMKPSRRRQPPPERMASIEQSSARRISATADPRRSFACHFWPKEDDARLGAAATCVPAAVHPRCSLQQSLFYFLPPAARASDESHGSQRRRQVPIASRARLMMLGRWSRPVDRLLRAVCYRLIRKGTLQVTTATGSSFCCGDGTGTPLAIRFASRTAEWRILMDPELRLGEAYMDGNLIIDQGSIAEFLDLAVKNLSRTYAGVASEMLRTLRSFARRLFENNTLGRAQRNAIHHYNIDHRIYRLFLDSDLQYSCAYFENSGASLDRAQVAKKNHIAAKLLLKPGLKVLDIGSGWGGLGLDLARNFNVSVVGLNLSDEQVRIARQRAAAEALPCEFRIADYR